MPSSLVHHEQTNHEPPASLDDEVTKTGQDFLQSNDDYQMVSKTLNVLRHQLQQALVDATALEDLKKEAMADPLEFVAQLKANTVRHRIPRLQRIVSVPDVDWSKYRFVPESRLAEQAASLQMIAQRVSSLHTGGSAFKNVLDVNTTGGEGPSYTPSAASRLLQEEIARAKRLVGFVPSRASSVSEVSDHSDDERLLLPLGKGKGKRRMSTVQTGAESNGTATPVTPSTPSAKPLGDEDLLLNDDTKSTTHNLQWSDEEQRLLEKYLEIYPDEPVQSQRFIKISKALGTRTPRQVASRVQKYFIKLARLGLPVPGRITIPPSSLPKTTSRSSPKAKGGNARGNRSRGRASSTSGTRGKPHMARTSGSGYNAMVSGGITNTRISGAMYMNAQAPPSLLMSEDDQDEDDIKKAMLNVNNKIGSGNTTSEAAQGDAVHLGYACDACGVEPIVGVRYKCTVCDVSEEVDLCSQCMGIGTFTNDHHVTDHTFEAFHTACAPYYADTDYTSSEPMDEYGYLGY